MYKKKCSEKMISEKKMMSIDLCQMWACPTAEKHMQIQTLLCYPRETKERKEKLVKRNLKRN